MTTRLGLHLGRSSLRLLHLGGGNIKGVRGEQVPHGGEALKVVVGLRCHDVNVSQLFGITQRREWSGRRPLGQDAARLGDVSEPTLGRHHERAAPRRTHSRLSPRNSWAQNMA